MIRVVGLIRVLSVVLFLIVLGLVYAYLPVMVRVLPQDATLLFHREYVFYSAVGLFFLINLFVFMLIKMVNPLLLSRKGEEMTAWFNSIGFVINVYVATLFGFIGVLNNPLHISASSYGYLNYMGPILLMIWIVGIIYFSVKKKSTT
jgi:hypothetical protein